MEKIYYGESDYHFGELRLPKGEGPHPVAIVVHGGFWRKNFGLEVMKGVSEDLTDKGWATWNIEYRRVGQEGGAWPGTLTDTAKACDYLSTLAHTYPLDLGKVVTIGHSAGGQLALWLAGRHRLPHDSELNMTNSPLPIAGAVSLAGVNDLKMMHEVHHFRDQTLSLEPNNPTADLLQGSPESQPKRYQEASPLALLPLGVPQVLVHGSLDVNVPAGISDHYYRMAEEYGDFVKYVEIPTAEHFMLTDPTTEAWAIVQEEMNLLLKSLS